MSFLKTTPTYEYTHTPLRGEFAKSAACENRVQGCSAAQMLDILKCIANDTYEDKNQYKKLNKTYVLSAKGSSKDHIIVFPGGSRSSDTRVYSAEPPKFNKIIFDGDNYPNGQVTFTPNGSLLIIKSSNYQVGIITCLELSDS